MPPRAVRSPRSRRRLCPDCGMPIDLETEAVSCCGQTGDQSSSGRRFLPFLFIFGGMATFIWCQSLMVTKMEEMLSIQERILSELTSRAASIPFPVDVPPAPYPSTPCPPRLSVTAAPPSLPAPPEDSTALQAEVERMLKQYDADKTARSDLALETAGGRILSTRSTKPYGDLQWPWSLLSPIMCSGSNMAANILRAGVQPGQCWPFEGQRGEAVVQLLALAHVQALALEHIPASISPTQEISSAPRAFSLWGLRSKHEEAADGHLFGEYEYSLSGPPLQHFPVQHLTSEVFSIVLFRVSSNWGHPAYTCVYRLRIHGELAHKQ